MHLPLFQFSVSMPLIPRMLGRDYLCIFDGTQLHIRYKKDGFRSWYCCNASTNAGQMFFLQNDEVFAFAESSLLYRASSLQILWAVIVFHLQWPTFFYFLSFWLEVLVSYTVPFSRSRGLSAYHLLVCFFAITGASGIVTWPIKFGGTISFSPSWLHTEQWISLLKTSWFALHVLS